MEIKEFSHRVYKNLFENILPFWRTVAIDTQNGGFVGKVTFDGFPIYQAPKSLVLNAQLLWVFSSICLYEKRDIYLPFAQQSFDYIVEHFLDVKYGGAYWQLNAEGKVIDTQKEIYGQAFLISALVEHYKVTQDMNVLQYATNLFDLMEEKSHDDENLGYSEAFKRDWTPLNASRSGENSKLANRSLLTHLYILGAFTSLCRIWKDGNLFYRLKELIELFLEKIINADSMHFRLYFNKSWNETSNQISFGLDMESSWILCEAAQVLGNKDVIEQVEQLALNIADTTLEEGTDLDNGLFYQATQKEITDFDKHWWPQAEAAVGFLNAFMISQDRRYYEASVNSWLFIEKNLIDTVNKEWHWKVTRGLEPIQTSPKVSPWKGPFNNGRACIELLRRLYHIKAVHMDQVLLQ